VDFLRFDHGDATEIAPSLYAGRGGHRRSRADEPEAAATTTTTTTTATASPAPATPVASPPPNIPQDDPFGRT
jgi:hypothetical protein